MGRDLKTLATFSFSIGLGIFLCFSVMLDIYAARSGFASISLLMVVLFSLPLIGVAIVMQRRWMSWTLAISLLVVITMQVTAWHPRKRFVRAVGTVREGMTVAEVEGVMAGYVKGRGAKWKIPGMPMKAPPKDWDAFSGTITYRWNITNGAYDSDWGLVTFEKGKVTRAEFHGD